MIDNFRRHRRICAMLLLILLPACYRWQLAATSPIRQEDVPPGGKVLITRTDGSRIELQRVSVSSDTLAGVPGYYDGIQDMQQVPLADISWLETPKLAVAETVALTLGSVLTLVLMVWMSTVDWNWGGVLEDGF